MLNKQTKLALAAAFCLCLLWAATPTFAMQLDPPPVTDSTLSLTAHVNRTYLLTPALTAISDTVALDGASRVYLTFSSPLDDLAVVLTSPAGQSYSANGPDTELVSSAVVTDTEGAITNYFFMLEQPAVGWWSYTLQATGVMTQAQEVLLGLDSTSIVRTGVLGGGKDYRPDREVHLELVTMDDAGALADVNIQAILYRLNDADFMPVVVNFADNGLDGDRVADDGVFSLSLSPQLPGEYMVDIDVGGMNAQNEPFQRSTTAIFTIVPLMATLQGTYTDRSIDLDDDGLVDQIGIAPAIEIFEPGEYGVRMVLAASNAQTMATGQTFQLDAGMVHPELLFDTIRLKKELGVDGPYTIRQVWIDYHDGYDTPIADMFYNSGLTSAYTQDQFERPDILLGAESTHAVVDADGNGLYDSLLITAPLNLVWPGEYAWSGQLVDASGATVDWSTGRGLLDSQTPLTLRFLGSDLRLANLDGPYQLTNVSLYRTDNEAINQRFFNVHTTDAYTAGQFDASSGCGGLLVWPTNAVYEQQIVELTNLERAA